MNAPRCGICGSADIVMNDTGLFVCSDCGARFTIEAMRNLMADGDEKRDGGNPNANPQPQSRYGNAISDALVDQFERGLYDLAAASWEQIKGNTRELNPWVILLGSLAEELNKGMDETMYLGPSYATFKHACEVQIDNPIIECPLYIKALSTCTTVPISSIKRQQESARAAIETRDIVKAIDYNATVNTELIGLDKIRIHALIDIACCVSAGYILSNEEWAIVKLQVDAINVTRKIPLVDRIYNRLKNIIAASFVAPEYALPPADATEDQIVERARVWWGAGDYDLATKAYGRLIRSDDTAISVESDTAIRFLSHILDDLGCSLDINTTFMERRYKESCDKAIVIGGAKGCDLLEQLIRVGKISTDIGGFYLRITQAYISIRDADNADTYIAISKRYSELTKQSYIIAMESLVSILDREPADIDAKRIARWKFQLDLLEGTNGDGAIRVECLRKLKAYYIQTLKDDSSFQDELASIISTQDNERARIDAKIAEIEHRITEHLTEIAELEIKEIVPEITRLKTRVEQLDPDINSREARIDEMEEEAAKLESDIKDKQATYNSLGLFARKKKTEIKAEIEPLRAQAADLKDLIDTAVDEVNERIDEMNAAIDRIAVLKGQRAKAEAMIERPELYIDRNTDAIVDQEGKLAVLREKLSDLVDQLEVFRAGRSKVKDSLQSERELAEQKWQSLKKLLALYRD